MSSTPELKVLQEALLVWYQAHGRKSMLIRNLTGPNAPYEIYVSEIMSQQTRIEVVLDKFYLPFLQAFPTLIDLANAPLDRVLLLWKGLGYYARAKNLHKSAQICCQKYGGCLPSNYTDLLALPGIGAYSASAILCFGFRQNVGVLDTNVSRVLLRLFGLDLKSKNLKTLLQDKARAFVNPTNSFDHNQALIDLGSLICTPKPSCHICPLSFSCCGKENIERFSVVKKTPSIPITKHYGVCVETKNLYLTYTQKGLYAHLYQFPLLKEQDLIPLPLLGSVRHSYTKYRVQVWLYQATLEDLQPENLVIVALASLKQLPMSSLGAKIVVLLEKRGIL
ncbi:A/G-specific adenine glycosylase MutY [Helicobacter suis]|nr:A/G-specific adenine glycosylase MutY [Helicobacter suis]